MYLFFARITSEFDSFCMLLTENDKIGWSIYADVNDLKHID